MSGRLRRIARVLLWLFLALYVLALAIFAIGTFGWFGQARDPLSGVFLIILGLPWIGLASALGLSGPLPALFAPAITAGLLFFISKR